MGLRNDFRYSLHSIVCHHVLVDVHFFFGRSTKETVDNQQKKNRLCVRLLSVTHYKQIPPEIIALFMHINGWLCATHKLCICQFVNCGQFEIINKVFLRIPRNVMFHQVPQIMLYQHFLFVRCYSAHLSNCFRFSRVANSLKKVSKMTMLIEWTLNIMSKWFLELV